jgi:hypothetical protein
MSVISVFREINLTKYIYKYINLYDANLIPLDRYLNIVFNKIIWRNKYCMYFYNFDQICGINTNNYHSGTKTKDYIAKQNALTKVRNNQLREENYATSLVWILGFWEPSNGCISLLSCRLQRQGARKGRSHAAPRDCSSCRHWMLLQDRF